MIHDGNTKLVGGSLAGLLIPSVDTLPENARPNRLVAFQDNIRRNRGQNDWAYSPTYPVPNGQAEYTSPGTYYLTVPKYVTFVSGACVGGGGNGGHGSGYRRPGGSGGGGAAVAYDTFPVSAGDTIKVVVGDVSENSYIEYGGQTLVYSEGGDDGVGSNTYLGSSTQGGNGGSVFQGYGASGQKGGSGQSKSENNDGGHGGDPGNIGLGAGRIAPEGSVYGHGGGGRGSGTSGSNGSPFYPGKGGARVIWGTDRQYPSSNVGDM